MTQIRRNSFPRLNHLWLLLVILWAPWAGAQAAQEPGDTSTLTFGFLPILSAERLVQRFSPLVAHLASELGRPVHMETAPDFREFVRRTQTTHRYDILFTAPHLYYMANQRAGYRARVRVASPGMHAVIVVPNDSSIQSLADLKGRRLATTDPISLATVLLRARLVQAGLDPERDLTLIATPTHNASLLLSLRGAADASALMEPAYRKMLAEMHTQTRIIAITDSAPHIPISTAPWVDEVLADKIATILLKLRSSEKGRSALKRSGWPGFTPVQPGEYERLGWVVDQIDWQ